VNTRVLAEQAPTVEPSQLGKSVGFLSFDEMRRVDASVVSSGCRNTSLGSGGCVVVISSCEEGPGSSAAKC
jgi:hypothetical protein